MFLDCNKHGVSNFQSLDQATDGSSFLCPINWMGLRYWSHGKEFLQHSPPWFMVKCGATLFSCYIICLGFLKIVEWPTYIHLNYRPMPYPHRSDAAFALLHAQTTGSHSHIVIPNTIGPYVVCLCCLWELSRFPSSRSYVLNGDRAPRSAYLRVEINLERF